MILVVIGTRPEAIKLAPVILELKKRNIPHQVCLSGQHKNLDQQLSIFGIKPNANLIKDIFLSDLPLFSIAANILKNVSEVISSLKPSWVVVQGDTTTASMSALAAFYQKVPVAHVEAGLRTPTVYEPFPEELHRRCISLMATLNFAPTQHAADNLKGIGEKVIVTGNTVIDALKFVVKNNNFLFCGNKRSILFTCHRRENIPKLPQICDGLLELSKREDIDIVIPVHQNPQVRSIITKLLGNVSNIKLCEPMNYVEFITAMRTSHFIITDSGGVQEEAPFLKIPVLVLRTTTERIEGTENESCKLIEPNEIVTESHKLLDNSVHYNSMLVDESLYGDGKASERIVDELLSNRQSFSGW